jgi:hypothetical protein
MGWRLMQWMIDLSENQMFGQMTSPVYEEKKQSSLHYKLEEHPVPQA